MAFSFHNTYHHRLFWEDTSRSDDIDTLITRQPFLQDFTSAPSDSLLVGLTLANGEWSHLLSNEQTAYALAQLTALHLLPPVEVLDNGSALLDYRVGLRDCLSAHLIDELVAVLNARGRELHWQQVESSVYVCVVYYGVAACIDITSGQESLYLRCTNQRAEAICNAHHTTDIPLSLSGLQENLFERIDALLHDVRLRTLFWLAR